MKFLHNRPPPSQRSGLPLVPVVLPVTLFDASPDFNGEGIPDVFSPFSHGLVALHHRLGELLPVVTCRFCVLTSRESVFMIRKKVVRGNPHRRRWCTSPW